MWDACGLDEAQGAKTSRPQNSHSGLARARRFRQEGRGPSLVALCFEALDVRASGAFACGQSPAGGYAPGRICIKRFIESWQPPDSRRKLTSMLSRITSTPLQKPRCHRPFWAPDPAAMELGQQPRLGAPSEIDVRLENSRVRNFCTPFRRFNSDGTVGITWPGPSWIKQVLMNRRKVALRFDLADQRSFECRTVFDTLGDICGKASRVQNSLMSEL